MLLMCINGVSKSCDSQNNCIKPCSYFAVTWNNCREYCPHLENIICTYNRFIGNILEKATMLCMSVFFYSIAKLTGPIWRPPGSCRPQMGPMLAPWTLLSGSARNLSTHYLTPFLFSTDIMLLVLLPHWKFSLVWYMSLWQPMLYIAYQATNWQQPSLMLHWYSQSLPIHTVCLHWSNGKCLVISLLSISPKVVLSYDIFIPIFSISFKYWGRGELAAIS